ncbi:MAG: diadenylate cyclase CdaA [Paludibacteraceae bacterium]|jgi:uncharacterized protein (TIGR00159 family)|nr:diadenylate cyclase CdaA [Paludibacteraceae bacterium]MBQ6766544.1 diadenylate cyclase CdaA [Paludibacteraceae bacterium]MDY6372910.1 diadenylate cyclase CdaA [Bacteroidales bacterium]MDY6426784.1 diadenylate cyclase CdaA [Bacteroidales bacterium]
MFSLLTFGIKDFIDILLVAIILYQIYNLLKGTQAMNIFFAVLGFIVTWFIVKFILRMELLGSILDAIMNVGAIILVIMFQDEIKSFLTAMGSRTSHGLFGSLKRIFFPTSSHVESDSNIEEILDAVENCSTTKTGLLIVVQNNADLTPYIKTGETISAKISARLIKNIFFKNTPLHDGALIIANGRMVAAGCILPVSHNLNIPKQFGLRHRAALGISEKTDALAIVVSEETGSISVAQQSVIQHNLTIDELREILKFKK